MFHSKISISDLEVLMVCKESEIRSAQKELKIMEELLILKLEAAKTLPTHSAASFKPIRRGRYKSKISEVTCNCGHVTKYKLPLNVIDDFKCPKEK